MVAAAPTPPLAQLLLPLPLPPLVPPRRMPCPGLSVNLMSTGEPRDMLLEFMFNVGQMVANLGGLLDFIAC